MDLTHEIEERGNEMSVRQRAGVTAVKHEVESQHAGLDDVRVDQLLLAHHWSLLAGAHTHSRRHVQITHGSTQTVHCTKAGMVHSVSR